MIVMTSRKKIAPSNNKAVVLESIDLCFIQLKINHHKLPGRALERIKVWSADHAAAIGNGVPPELLAPAAERAHCFVVPRDHSVGLFCLHL